jgi:hypothetical protein
MELLMKINELISSFEIWTTNEEAVMLARLAKPVRLAAMNEHEQVIINNMIRKSLVIKVGHKDPMIVINEK